MKFHHNKQLCTLDVLMKLHHNKKLCTLEVLCNFKNCMIYYSNFYIQGDYPVLPYSPSPNSRALTSPTFLPLNLLNSSPLDFPTSPAHTSSIPYPLSSPSFLTITSCTSPPSLFPNISFAYSPLTSYTRPSYTSLPLIYPFLLPLLSFTFSTLPPSQFSYFTYPHFLTSPTCPPIKSHSSLFVITLHSCPHPSLLLTSPTSFSLTFLICPSLL